MIMETEVEKISVTATAMPSTGQHNVSISVSQDLDHFFLNLSNGSVSRYASFEDPNFPKGTVTHTLLSFRRSSVYPAVFRQFLDVALSGRITDEIVRASQLGEQQPFLINVTVKFILKKYMILPCRAGPRRERGAESETETCAICLDDMAESRSNRICYLPHCPHTFHENCFWPWLKGQNSCPVCRTPVYGED